MLSRIVAEDGAYFNIGLSRINAVTDVSQYYICSPTRYTTFIMVEYLFTICLTARHVSDLQVHPQEHL